MREFDLHFVQGLGSCIPPAALRRVTKQDDPDESFHVGSSYPQHITFIDTFLSLCIDARRQYDYRSRRQTSATTTNLMLCYGFGRNWQEYESEELRMELIQQGLHHQSYVLDANERLSKGKHRRAMAFAKDDRGSQSTRCGDRTSRGSLNEW
jgi:hypothetical protein